MLWRGLETLEGTDLVGTAGETDGVPGPSPEAQLPRVKYSGEFN